MNKDGHSQRCTYLAYVFVQSKHAHLRLLPQVGCVVALGFCNLCFPLQHKAHYVVGDVNVPLADFPGSHPAVAPCWA